MRQLFVGATFEVLEPRVVAVVHKGAGIIPTGGLPLLFVSVECFLVCGSPPKGLESFSQVVCSCSSWVLNVSSSGLVAYLACVDVEGWFALVVVTHIFESEGEEEPTATNT